MPSNRDAPASGSVGEFANTKRDSENLDFAVELEKLFNEGRAGPGLAAVLGAIDAIPGNTPDMFSRARVHHPYVYRGAQAAVHLPLAAALPAVGLPWLAMSIGRDPIVQRFYNDQIAPRPLATNDDLVKTLAGTSR